MDFRANVYCVSVFLLGALLLLAGAASEAEAQEGRSCWLFDPCDDGYSCEALAQVCRAPGDVGDPCHWTRPCGAGLSCQPGVHKCYNTPRKVGQPCVAGHECGDGLYCQSFLQKCVPQSVEFNGRGPCSGLFVQATAEDAKRLGGALAFGTGAAATAGRSVSLETGLVYGENGQFGCYVSACLGYETDVSKSGFVNIGVAKSYSDFAGFAVVTGQGVDTPFVKVGFQTSQAWSTEPPTGAISNPGDLVLKRLVGTSSGLSYGVGLSPVSAGAALCFTAVLDGSDPLDQFRAIPGLMTRWAEAGFDPGKIPSRLKQLTGVERENTRTIALRGAHGKYLSSEPDGDAKARGPRLRSWERWVMRDLNGGVLKSGDRVTLLGHHGGYLVADIKNEGGGDRFLAKADRKAASTWERWEITANGRAIGEEIRNGDLVSLRSHHGRYLVAEPDGRAEADRTRIGAWEKWSFSVN